jgi:hypothetical protein
MNAGFTTADNVTGTPTKTFAGIRIDTTCAGPAIGLCELEVEAPKFELAGVKVAVIWVVPVPGCHVRFTIDSPVTPVGRREPLAMEPPVELRTVTVPLGAIDPARVCTRATTPVFSPATTSFCTCRVVTVGTAATAIVAVSIVEPPPVAVTVQEPAWFGVHGR